MSGQTAVPVPDGVIERHDKVGGVLAGQGVGLDITRARVISEGKIESAKE